MQVFQLNAEEAREALPQLIALLKDGVDHGASIGFLPPLAIDEAEAYWQKRVMAIEEGDAMLFIVKLDEQIVGTAQLGLENRANGNHRAEVQKVIVHTAFRRRGIGKILMQALETAALEAKRTLLVLDTLHGEPSELLYQGMGYQFVGLIPQYARTPQGLEATALYYKLLGD